MELFIVHCVKSTALILSILKKMTVPVPATQCSSHKSSPAPVALLSNAESVLSCMGKMGVSTQATKCALSKSDLSHVVPMDASQTFHARLFKS